MAKVRLDQHLITQGHFETRNKARAAIMAGIIFVNDQRIDKAGTKIDSSSKITIKGDHCPYVSRGGLKLEQAIQSFQLNLTDYRVLDVGASTGGFTDCALQHGAKQVYAVDVGYGQLAWSLRQDPRVQVIERTNIRYLSPDDLPKTFDLVTIDVSFISLKIVIPAARQFLRPAGSMVLLLKPQFEAGRERVGKNGVVRDPRVHFQVISEIVQLANREDLQVLDLAYSPITGAAGHNIEFLLYLSDGLENTGFSVDKIEQVIEKAHQELNQR